MRWFMAGIVAIAALVVVVAVMPVDLPSPLDQLTDVVAVVIEQDEGGAQGVVGCLLGRRRAGVEVALGIFDQLGHLFGGVEECPYALGPRLAGGRFCALRPIALGPGQMIVVGVLAVAHQIPSRDLHVLDLLPGRMRVTVDLATGERERKFLDGGKKTGMGLARAQQASESSARLFGAHDERIALPEARCTSKLGSGPDRPAAG